MRRPISRGFTLIEMMIVLLIIGITSLIAFSTLRRSRPRATVRGAMAELRSLVHNARQEALATGLDTWVLVFPEYDNGVSKGRIIALVDDSDPAQSLQAGGAALNFAKYLPGTIKATANGRVIGSVDLPAGVLVGPATGAGVHDLKFPYASIALDTACGFCGTAGEGRGAVVFDSRGRVTFKRVSGTSIENSPDCDSGASLSIYSTDLQVGTANNVGTLIITRPQGMLRNLENG